MRINVDTLKKVLKENGYVQEGRSDFWKKPGSDSRHYYLDLFENLTEEEIRVFSGEAEEDDE